MSGALPARGQYLASKVPEVTVAFWLAKICATTVGETCADALSMTLKLGYAVTTVIFLAAFLATISSQIRAHRYEPAVYWLVVVATTTVGTTVSDFIDRTLPFGYGRSSVLLFGIVVAVLLAWRLVAGKIAADRIATRTDEAFYWLAILTSNTLGTALGDFTADKTGLGLGFECGALLFAALLGVAAIAHRLRLLPRTILFWAAYVLTRPLGATLGDTLTKPRAQGGLGFGRFDASFAIAAAMTALIVFAPPLWRPANIPTDA